MEVGDSLRLLGSGELVDEMQGALDSGSHSCGRGDVSIVDVQLAAHPVDRRVAGLEGLDPRPVAGGVEPVEHVGGREDHGPAADPEDPRPLVVLTAHPLTEGSLGAAGGVGEAGHDDQVWLERWVGIDVGERERRDDGRASFQWRRGGVGGDDVRGEGGGAGEDVVGSEQVAGDGAAAAGDERHHQPVSEAAPGLGVGDRGRRCGSCGDRFVETAVGDHGPGQGDPGEEDDGQDHGHRDHEDAVEA